MLCLIGKSFGGLDLTFFLTYLAITLVIGFWVGRREKATGEKSANECGAAQLRDDVGDGERLARAGHPEKGLGAASG